MKNPLPTFLKSHLTTKKNRTDVTNRPTLLQVSVAFNFLLLFVLFFVIRHFNKPVVSSNDELHDLIKRDSQAISELSGKIQDLNKQQVAAFEAYQRDIQQSMKDHDDRLKELEKKKTSSAAQIVKKYEGDLEGLASEFSKTMGIR